jgi:hypothetical protein
MGRPIKNLHNVKERFKSYMSEPDENLCQAWKGRCGKNGYGFFYLTSYYEGQISHSGKQVYAHRFSYELHVEKIPEGLWVLHRCDNRKCVSPAHLFLGTHSDNMKDMAAKNRNPITFKKGSLCKSSKLTEKDIPVIRNLLKEDIYQTTIARLFKVDPKTIHAIKVNKTWRHV